jgi:hypothetical protein
VRTVTLGSPRRELRGASPSAASRS